MKLYTDGGARGNPGPAAIGVCLKDNNNQIVANYGAYIGESTNNEAEYKGILFGLKIALKKDIKDIECYLDSELVVNQLNGAYKVKNERLSVLYNRVVTLLTRFENVTFTHIPRNQNKEADNILNQVLDLMLD